MFLVSDEEKSPLDLADTAPVTEDLPVEAASPSPQVSLGTSTENLSQNSTPKDTVQGGPTQVVGTSQEDEGWQEAVSRGRSFGASTRRSGHKGFSSGSAHNGGSAYTGGHHRNHGGVLRERGNFTPAGTISFASKKRNQTSGSTPPQLITAPITSADGGQQSAKASTSGRASISTVANLPAKPAPSPSVVPQIDTATEAEDQENRRGVLPETRTAAARPPSSSFSKTTGGPPSTGRSAFSYKEVALAPPGSRSAMRPAVELPAVVAAPESIVKETTMDEKVSSPPLVTASDEAQSSTSLSAQDPSSLIEAEAPVVAREPEGEEGCDLAEPSQELLLLSEVMEMEPEIVTGIMAAPSQISESSSIVDPPENLSESDPPGTAQEEILDLEGSSNVKTILEEEIVVKTEKRDSDNVGGPAESEVPETEVTSDDSTSPTARKLSAAAPPFNPNVGLGRKPAVSKAVAVTPFKDGKAPPVTEVVAHIPLPPLQVPAAVAVTPIRRPPPPLAPLPHLGYMMPGTHFGAFAPGFVPPLPFHQKSLLGNGPYLSGLPALHPLPPPIQVRTVQMNPNAEEFIPWYLREPCLPSPGTPPVATDTPDVQSTEEFVGESPPVNVEDAAVALESDTHVVETKVEAETEGEGTEQSISRQGEEEIADNPVEEQNVEVEPTLAETSEEKSETEDAGSDSVANVLR